MGRQRIHRAERGYILFVGLVFAILLGMGSLLAIGPTISEVQSAGQQLRDKRAFFRADGGAALCLREMRNRLQRDLAARLRPLADLTNVEPYLTNNDPAGFLATYAHQDGTSYGSAFQRVSASEARLAPPSFTPPDATGPYACTLTLLSRAAPAIVGTAFAPGYLFRYRYSIDSSAAEGATVRQVNLQGIFAVQVQQDTFARYALFTNRQRNAAGSLVWFTNRTNFSGPVHTNEQFNFALNPSGTFTGLVTSVSSTARFYNGGSSIELNADRNENLDVPTFGAGFERGVPNIPMPSTTVADRQREVALGLPLGSGAPAYPDGVYPGANAETMTGGIYIRGDAAITLSADSDTAIYTITRLGPTTTVTVNYAAEQTVVRVGGTSTTFTGVPNGMIFTDGSLTSLSGTVQRNSRVTVAATGDILITNHLRYEHYTAGTGSNPPSAEGTRNILGILSWNGNVRIGTMAPNDISVHATVMTPNGEFRVDNHDSGAPRGIATILGGVIEDTYGAFGTFGARNTGYGRNFVYDTRMARGMAPPFFPTIGSLVGMVSGINDRPNWQQTP
jgi:hypothetical protein